MFNCKYGKEEFYRQTQFTEKFTRIFEENSSFKTSSYKFLKSIRNTIAQSFTKRRVVNSNKKKYSSKTDFENNNEIRYKLIKYMKECKCKLGKTIAQTKLRKIEEEIVDSVSENNRRKIENMIKEMENENGEFAHTKFWNMKAKLLPKPVNPPVAIKDKKGNLITSSESLKMLYRSTYKERLAPAVFDDVDIK